MSDQVGGWKCRLGRHVYAMWWRKPVFGESTWCVRCGRKKVGS